MVLGVALALAGQVGSAATPEQMAAATPAMRLAAVARGGITPAEQPLARQLLHRAGFGAAAPGMMTYRWGVAPLLRFDPNINGGYADDTLQIGGLDFRLEPDEVGRSGVMAGIRGHGTVTFGLAPRLALDLSASGRMARALREDSRKSQAALSLCLRALGPDLNQLRLCLDRGLARNAQSASAESGVELGLSRPFLRGDALAEAGIFLRRQTVGPREEARQMQLGTRLSRVGPAGVRLDLDLAAGAPVRDHIAMRWRGSLGVQAHVLGDWTRLSLGLEARRGGRFLGQPRREEAYSISLSRNVTMRLPGGGEQGVVVTLSANRVRAGHAVLSHEGVALDLGLTF